LSNLVKRTITGILIVFLIITGITFSSISFFFLFLLALAAGLYEFYSLSHMAKVRPQTYFGILIGILFFVLNFLYAIGFLNQKFFFVFIPLIILVFINELYKKHNRPFTNIAYTFLGLIYIAVPISLFNYFVFSPNGELFTLSNPEEKLDAVNFIFQPPESIIYSPQILLGFFILFWANDTGAYLVGIPFGKHRLFKRISPKKSWEGFFGGAIIAFIASYLLSLFFNHIRLVDWLAITFIIVTIGTFGDLTESLFKRSIGVKDSGKLFPGHGGLLDRFDGILLSSPVVFTYLKLIS